VERGSRLAFGFATRPPLPGSRGGGCWLFAMTVPIAGAGVAALGGAYSAPIPDLPSTAALVTAATASSVAPQATTLAAPGSRRPQLAWAGASALAVLAARLARAARRRRACGTDGRRQPAVHLGAARRSRGAKKRQRGGNVKEKEPDQGEAEDGILIFPADGMPVNEMAQKLGKNPAGIITHFFAKRGVALTVNSTLDREQMIEIAAKYDIEVLFDDEEAAKSVAADRGILAEDHSGADSRPAVVTVMGHVDHGKTTLLDTIRQRSVAATEAGGITQRIGAYTVEVGDQKATFIDTPGHEAFTSMRARGAQVTDIAVLVVAADDGVMPQTREAIAHAKAAEVPIIVAINKIDKPGANADQARQKLSEEGLIPEEWGGEVPMVEVSAKKNLNIDNLLEIITLTAQVGDLKAPKDGPAAGTILESALDSKAGTLVTLLVQRGTLKVGDVAVAGSKLCRVRAMTNEAGTQMREAGPSTAVQVSGFDKPPESGDRFEVYASLQDARRVVEQRRKDEVKQANTLGFAGGHGDELKLAIILKADSQGSIAAVKYMFEGMKDSKHVNLRWVLAAPGIITEADVTLAATAPKDQTAMIVGFNTTISPEAAALAKNKQVGIKNFEIIYELFETVIGILEEKVGLEEQFVERGRAEVLAVFNARNGKVAGCSVLEGQLTRGHRVKIYRRGRKVAEGDISTLREGKSDVTSVDEGNECGFGVSDWDEWEQGDEVHCFEVSMISPDIMPSKSRNK